MERLTERTVSGTVNLRYPKSCYYADGGKDQIAVSAYRQNALERLAAYEDTGLEPKDIKAVIDGAAKEFAEYDELMTKHRIKELAQAEQDGRLVVLPCKVGDTAWTNMAIVGDRYKSADRPYPGEIVFIGIGGNGGFFHVQYSNGRIFPFDFDKVGKNVFLTREEAEAALKKEGD